MKTEGIAKSNGRGFFFFAASVRRHQPLKGFREPAEHENKAVTAPLWWKTETLSLGIIKSSASRFLSRQNR
jgi:hypothetical protein